jgi:hypothetical protein
VAGIDEASARFLLAEMQDRLARDPASALGVEVHATTDDVRAAFLQLTKQFHPVRFGRMAQDIQKLSNEVFLALRAAHDAVAKSARSRTGPMAVPRVPGASAAVPSVPAGRASQSAKLARPGSPNEAGEKPTPSSGVKVQRPSQPAPRVLAPGSAPIRAPGTAPPATVRDEAAVLDLLQRQQWDQARSALHQLQARDPSSKRIRALMCYARGREAQLGGMVDDARVELQDALDLDPELQVAKTALTELFTRRK